MVSKMPNVTWPKGMFVETVGVAEVVVLYHRAPRRHLGRGFRIQVRSPNAADLLDGERPKLVFVGRVDCAANAYPKHGGQKHQARQCGLGDASSPDPSLSTPDLQSMGV